MDIKLHKAICCLFLKMSQRKTERVSLEIVLLFKHSAKLMDTAE